MAYYFYGLRAVLVCGVSVFSSILADYVSHAAMRRKFDWSDESPLMSGLLLALLMPASVPYTIMAFSAAFMSVVGKNAFGGNKNLIFCPVCISYIFTALCFPSEILRYPTPTPFGELSLSNIVTDALGYSFTHNLDSGTASAFSLLDMVWGRLTGPMGTSAILIILISAVAMYFFGDIPPMVLFAGFAANVLLSVLFPVGETGWYAVINSFAAGSYLFVLVFMACDPRYTPKRTFSQLLYGCAFAAGAFIIRRNTGIENGAIFMLPILCIFRDEFDRLSSALERLLKFLWKWIEILSIRFSRFVLRVAKIISKTVAILVARIARAAKYGLGSLIRFLKTCLFDSKEKTAVKKTSAKSDRSDTSVDTTDAPTDTAAYDTSEIQIPEARSGDDTYKNQEGVSNNNDRQETDKEAEK